MLSGLLVAALSFSARGLSWHAAVGVPRASPLVLAETAADKLSFDEALAGVLAAAESAGSLQPVLDSWLDKVDEMFVPTLASRLEAVSSQEAPDMDEVARLSALLGAIERRSLDKFTEARDQLQDLLGAGEINAMDARLCKMISTGKLDAGFLYVLHKNMDDARSEGDDQLLKLLTHIHTRTEEELEKRTPPGLALLHKLTRTTDAALRGRILRHYLVPQGTVKLPDGTQMPLDTPAPALVPPTEFAQAVYGALDKVLAMPIDRSAIASTVEEVRTVAKEARAVIEESYSTEDLDAFTNTLTPIFERARSS
uniref:Uncharacterized protein n=1 Tax=Strombidinopsis acuminata TaxID=141414 RepID=A0A7S3SIL1_9SPIT|mmetsp:Transcript_12936/g.39486  ORF Transcript_12936/g.39486 Transcript_12936/m.39486 type:complete len:311 (-) Transcript_12936:291-1223(-)